MDKRVSGWLNTIYDKWICYEADKNVLQANKILSVPKYIEKDTGMEFEVDDGLFDRLVNKHKDLPDNIIGILAENQSRNNFIVSDYLNNKTEYGKTLIFADRWFQCEYIIEKLKEQGVKANAVYNVITGQDSTYQGGMGRHNNKMNEEIMQDFRDGKYEVIVNVKMLTEGVDVPDVKTVMITRQTTSSILLTQMIGRALRGEKAGGGKDKDYANIVFFHDTWKRVLPWANVQGGTDSSKPPKQGKNPIEVISIQLIKLATADIEYKGFENAEFLTFIPVGFFTCEYTVADEEEATQELNSFEGSALVYEFNKEKYNKLIDFLIEEDLSLFAAENIVESQINEKSEELADKFFDFEVDDFDGLLIENIANIIRHIAQNNKKPEFMDFKERDLYDMDKLAESLADTSPLKAKTILKEIFNDKSKHWGFLYKKYENFKDAFDKSINRILADDEDGEEIEFDTVPQIGLPELTPEIKQQVLERDKHTCLCCGIKAGKGVSLNADHIKPVSMGGTNDIENLQTLCKQCNFIKGKNEINFRINKSPLSKPKDKLQFQDMGYDGFDILRIVDTFYHCKALRSLFWGQRKGGKYYSTWEIELYKWNNPKWLQAHEAELLEYIQIVSPHVTKIIIRN
jgi:predicted DNA binding CopG/RHH family protein